MTDSDRLLPAPFADLEPFARQWGNSSTTDERYATRQKSSIADLRAFYAAAAPRIEAIFDYHDTTPYDQELPAAEQRLYDLALALAEVACAVEVFDQPDVPHRDDRLVVRAVWTGDT